MRGKKSAPGAGLKRPLTQGKTDLGDGGGGKETHCAPPDFGKNNKQRGEIGVNPSKPGYETKRIWKTKGGGAKNFTRGGTRNFEEKG